MRPVDERGDGLDANLLRFRTIAGDALERHAGCLSGHEADGLGDVTPGGSGGRGPERGLERPEHRGRVIECPARQHLLCVHAGKSSTGHRPRQSSNQTGSQRPTVERPGGVAGVWGRVLTDEALQLGLRPSPWHSTKRVDGCRRGDRVGGVGDGLEEEWHDLRRRAAEPEGP